MKHIIRAFKMLPSWKLLATGIFLTGVLNAAIAASIPLAVQKIIDRLIQNINQPGGSIHLILAPLVLWGCLRLGLILIGWLTEIVSDNAFRAVAISFREKCVDKLEELSITYYEKRRAGQIASEVNQSPFKFADWIQDIAENVLPAMLRAIFVLIVLGYKYLPIALIIVGVATLYAWFVFSTMSQNRKWWAKNRLLSNELFGVQTENIAFASDIKALGIRDERGKLYRSYLHEHDRNLFKMFKYQHGRNFIAGLIEIAMYVLPLGIFAHRALQGQQSPSDIYLLAVYLATISEVSSRLARVWARIVEVNDTLGETLEILDQADVVSDPDTPRKLEHIVSVKFHEVTFAYTDKKQNAIENVSLEVGRGETLALVGRSGSGKSTIIKLLLRFYDTASGDITLNGVPLSSYAQSDFRKAFGVVMQEVALFNDTIGNNIAIALPGAPKEQVIKAARIAHAHEFISVLPDGYDTVVGERGVKLSGGEKQRVSIARAILRDPEVVLLDEATSALDSESEKLVQDGLKKLLKNRTAIIIAHRLSTIAHADKIVVLDNGRVVQQGSYSELKSSKGLFADLLKHQEL